MGKCAAADFLAAESEAVGHDVGPAFSTFTDQTGVPLVSVALRCEAGRPPRLTFTQEPYRPLGSPAAAGKRWQIPLSFKYGTGATPGRDGMLLTAQATERVLPSGKGGPPWVLVNPGPTGYYHVRYEGDPLPRLLREGGSHVTAAERVALALLPQIITARSNYLMQSVTSMLGGLGALIPETLRPQYAAYLRRTFGPPARALGWTPRPGEDEETQLLRVSTLRLAAGDGESPALGAEARRLADRWLEDPRGFDPNLAPLALQIAARGGDRALFERIQAAARRTQDPRERQMLLAAMASFHDPELLNAALALTLTDEFHPADAAILVFVAAADPEAAGIVYEFVKAHFDALIARMPGREASRLPTVASSFNDQQRLADVQAFFAERASRLLGGPRILQQALDQIRLNCALKQAQLPSLEAFLRSDRLTEP